MATGKNEIVKRRGHNGQAYLWLMAHLVGLGCLGCGTVATPKDAPAEPQTTVLPTVDRLTDTSMGVALIFDPFADEEWEERIIVDFEPASWVGEDPFAGEASGPQNYGDPDPVPFDDDDPFAGEEPDPVPFDDDDPFDGVEQNGDDPYWVPWNEEEFLTEEEWEEEDADLVIWGEFDDELFDVDTLYGEALPFELTDRTAKVIGADERVRVTNNARYPYSAVGQLMCTFPNGVTSLGTGAMISNRHVLTAAHVIYNQSRGGWASRVTFIPGKRDNIEPFGRVGWQKGTVYTTHASGFAPNWDIGVVTLERSIGQQTGYLGMWSATDEFFNNAYLHTAGYPGDKSGTSMYYAPGRSRMVKNNSVIHWLDIIRGQSGAPIWLQYKGHSYIVAVQSAECLGQGCTENYGARTSVGIINAIREIIRVDG